jgi:hypothetical protein
MSRRLLDLCLLAYPRARRERDRAYLRDLALDLAESHMDQASRRGRIRPCGAGLAANELVGTTESDRERIHEVEHFAWGEGGP